jgi:hypothetical protein
MLELTVFLDEPDLSGMSERYQNDLAIPRTAIEVTVEIVRVAGIIAPYLTMRPDDEMIRLLESIATGAARTAPWRIAPLHAFIRKDAAPAGTLEH